MSNPPSATPLVTLVVLNWNGHDLLTKTLPPLLAQTYASYRVVVIDNASSDDSVTLLEQRFPSVEVIVNEGNLGFSRGMNAGLRALAPFADGELLLLLNNDVYVQPTWLADFVAAWQATENVGVASCKLLFPNGQVQHLGGRLHPDTALSEHFTVLPPSAETNPTAHDVDYVTGAALLFDANTLKTIGYLDAFFSPFYYEEVDFCYRVRAAGQRVVVFPEVSAIHDESTSINAVDGLKLHASVQNRLRFALKHFSAEHIATRFVPAETTLLRRLPSTHVQVERHILTDCMLNLSTWLAGWDRSDDLPSLMHSLRQLHNEIRANGVTDRPADNTLRSQPFDFTQHSAIFGRIRATWHAVAGRWALTHQRDQQNAINQTLLRALVDAEAANKASAAEIDLLTQRIITLEQRLNALENDS